MFEEIKNNHTIFLHQMLEYTEIKGSLYYISESLKVFILFFMKTLQNIINLPLKLGHILRQAWKCALLGQRRGTSMQPDHRPSWASWRQRIQMVSCPVCEWFTSIYCCHGKFLYHSETFYLLGYFHHFSTIILDVLGHFTWWIKIKHSVTE